MDHRSLVFNTSPVLLSSRYVSMWECTCLLILHKAVGEHVSDLQSDCATLDLLKIKWPNDIYYGAQKVNNSLSP